MNAFRQKAHRPVMAPADAVSVAAQIAALEALDLGALRVQFRNRTGRIAPAQFFRALLLRVLAYRIQADLFGDLRPETRRLLERIASADRTAPSKGHTSGWIRPAERPRVGTVLVREWHGRMEHVMVLGDGFTWNGSTYPSLSAVALAITGTKWNGRRFFGLDRPFRAQPAEASSPGVGHQFAQASSSDTSKQRCRTAMPTDIEPMPRLDPLPLPKLDQRMPQRAST